MYVCTDIYVPSIIYVYVWNIYVEYIVCMEYMLHDLPKFILHKIMIKFLQVSWEGGSPKFVHKEKYQCC